MSEMNIYESLSIINETRALVSNFCWKFSSLEDPSFLEDMEKIQRAMCKIKGNFMSFLFYRKNVIELSEWLHEEYLNNNEDIHRLKNQNDQLFQRFPHTCSSSYVSYFHMVYFLEDFHDMVDHEKHGKLQFLDVFEDEKLIRSNHLLWWKRNLYFLLIMVTIFLKKCMIPLPWNQPMRKVFFIFEGGAYSYPYGSFT